MATQRMYKKNKKITVQLTSLLDLLFVMIFVSLIQQKTSTLKSPSIDSTTATPLVREVNKTITESKEVKPEAPIIYNVRAVFKFYATPGNPNIPSGSYNMQGIFDEKSRSLNLGGVSWNQRPSGYDMVPLSGTIERTHTLFKGRIDSPGCQFFTLRRIKTLNESPISGEWEGVYDCSQGPTGLRLTIQ